MNHYDRRRSVVIAARPDAAGAEPLDIPAVNALNARLAELRNGSPLAHPHYKALSDDPEGYTHRTAYAGRHYLVKMSTAPLLTPEEAGARLHRDAATVRRWCRADRIVCVDINAPYSHAFAIPQEVLITTTAPKRGRPHTSKEPSDEME